MKKYVLPVLASCIVIFSQCRKQPDYDKLSNEFVVQTSKASTANFGSYKTYFISDTIALRTTNPNDTLWFDADAKQLIDAVKAQMQARGYTLVAKGSNPDVGLALNAVKDLNIGVIYSGWWWWGYWGCYWYCYYPPYYPYYSLYSIPTGTLILDFIDLKNAEQEERLTVQWTSVMSGGLGNTSDDLALGIEAINQSFDQSPYLKTN
ncbi:DUF4136 domain-containing protein [Pollutibacter soli]|uniref:DUF4136 domain-containing protein n=1 Tax=Pollutibacter soli TaxID=3034157 RepID=UPI00301419FF